MLEPYPRINVPLMSLEAFCKKWMISELALFGSVLREDFNPQSDVDILVTFLPEARYGLFDMVHMENELRQIFGRKVDFVERAALRNPFRRRGILANTRVIYAAPRA